jgi:CheY-like chemotaxis protein
MSDTASRNPAIILVEDEPDILIILHRLMRDLTGGYDIVTVNGGAEALAQIALRPVPLVITDYNMPGMNGLQLAAAIKETSPRTSVVMITAYATPELEKKAREQRVDFYLPKPFPLDRLEQIVKEVLK